MAHDESSFKVEFRKALEKQYAGQAVIWTNNDMFRAGLPDFSAHYAGHFWGIEAKFVKALPAKISSKVLNHELSGIQGKFLNDIERTGGSGVVLVGFEDTAIACSISSWPSERSNGVWVPTANITLEKLLQYKEEGCAYYKSSSGWNLDGFLKLPQMPVPL